MGYIQRYFFSVCCVFVLTKAVFASTCATGYSTLDVEKHIDTYKTFDESTFMKPEGGLCKIGGYVLLEIPDDVVPIYNGFIMGNAVTLCDSGHMVNNNGSCVAYTQGNCHTNDKDIVADSSSFTGLNNGACLVGGYQLKEIPDDVYGIFGGFIMGDEITLCNNGFLVNNGSCSTYTSGECNANYYDLSVNADSFAELTNGTCSNPYTTTTQTTRCDRNPGSTCLMLTTPVININWYDRDTIIAQNSCYYEEPITLPENPPTRTGYIFSGWRLRTEQSNGE